MKNEKLRVLAICHEDPEFILGGMGMHLRELYRAMATRGDVEIDLLTSGPGEGAKNYIGYTKHQCDKLVCWRPRKEDLASLLLSDIQMMKTLAGLLAEGRRWDVIHTHEWSSVQIARMARDALKVPVIGTMHLCISALCDVDDGAPPAPGSDSLVPDWPEADLYLRQQEGHLVVTDSDELILCSRAYIDLARKTFLTDRPINLVYNGINPKEWNPLTGNGKRARSANDLPDRPLAMFCGRIADMKGIRPLLDVVEAQDTGYCVVLVGEVNAVTDQQREAWDVTQRIRKLEAEMPDRLRWLGFKHGQELRDLYGAAQVVLMPSVHEPFGIVALEALAMGVPLISTEVDGLGEIVCPDGGEEYAMIIPPNNARQLATALEILRGSPESRSHLIGLGLQRIHDFTWSDAAEKTVMVYHKALERAARARMEGVG